MDRLAHDAMQVFNARLLAHDRKPLDEWPPSPPGLSPVELAMSRAGFFDVCVRSGQLRFVHAHGVHTHYPMPPVLANFVEDWHQGKYPELVASDGPF
jgi:hypothetical protein